MRPVSRLCSRVGHQEAGVAMVVMMMALSLVLIISATAVGVSLTSKTASRTDRLERRALSAAESGLRAAAFSLNQCVSQPVGNDFCPGDTSTSSASGGWCPAVSNPYSLGDGTSYTYFISTAVAGNASLTCAGTSAGVDTVLRPGLSLGQRCITSTGSVGGVVQRVQMRVLADNAVTSFPIPGILGYDHVCLSCNTGGAYITPTPGAPANAGCQNRPPTGGQDRLIGVIGSNNAVFANLSSWQLSGTLTQKYLYVPTSDPCVNAGNYPGFVSSWFPTVQPDTLKTNSLPFPREDLNGLFRNPGPDATGDPGTYTPTRAACQATNTDAAVCNDNATGIVAATTGTNPCSANQLNQLDRNYHSNRVLKVPACRVTLATGTYDFCGLQIANNGQLEPALSTSVVRIMIDSYDRLMANGSHACPGSTPEDENGHIVNLAGSLLMSTATDPRQAQIFVYGNPTNPVASQFSFGNGTSFSFLFKGPNSVFQVQNAPTTGTPVMSGGVAAWGVEFQNNLEFRWDPRVDSITSGGSHTYYRIGWQQCRKPADLTSPTSGC
jgi:hypothetical protein